MDLSAQVKALPDRPGVYLFKGADGEVLYVGKAASLKKRVASYFQSGRPKDAKTTRLMREARDLEVIETASEEEALLLEAHWIKARRTRYNISLRDDKTYPSLRVTAEETYPRLYVGRGPVDPGIRVIGPFTDATGLKRAMRAIRRVIPYRTCRILPKRACLDYYLGLCSAPCEGRISPEAYREQMSRVLRLVEGNKEQVIREMTERMRQCAAERRYEEAARLRDQIAGLGELTVRSRRLNLSAALADLTSLLRLKQPPRRIEGFDISNIHGRQAVGSQVAFLDGKPDKNGYKRFRIKQVAGIDDYGMMREVVRRRYDEPGAGPLPDLILIDGGRGHLNAALEVLRELKLELPAVGIAKQFEHLYLPGEAEPLSLPPISRALQLLQRVRDEAHRFAIGYHRLLRGKAALGSALDEIPGVGPRKKQDLIVRFGSVEGMRRATVEELAQVRGISEGLARRIHKELNQ
ncbi:MAG: excinuclease ABC subunit C [Candidatus Omnitrophica bacterium CG11_big_fil_rev_8_21_14_0_20_64_10]|nr:MAG: excinuclease ABC subunit C [Candidatus Omnitrophica bacterium CG11_big_fil_rev_8_21_14_0_20_64_10]